MDHDDSLCLPPGFRFHPTDEEIVTHYLLEKVADQNFSSFAVAEANFNDCEPWDLPKRANMGEKEWFFFCKRDRKYPTGMRTNRATESGYWKATGKDKEIYKGMGVLVGMKKTLVFYTGRAPRGQKSNWVMHEYRLESKHQQPYSISRSAQYEWVVCKVYHKLKDTTTRSQHEISEARINSFVDDFFTENPSLPPLADSLSFNPSSKEGQEPKELPLNQLNQSYFYPQRHQLQGPHFYNGVEDAATAPLISDQALFSMRGQVKLEQSSNSNACVSQETGLSIERNADASSVSMQQINCLHELAEDSSTGLQDLDFDSMMNYGFM